MILPAMYCAICTQEKVKNVSQKRALLSQFNFADWVAPKKDGTPLQVCRYLKITVNQVSKLDKCPIPKIDDLFAQLAGGRRFTKLDMSQAYQQLVLEEDSRKYVVINTHRGLFHRNRLPFGILSALWIFQRVMELEPPQWYSRGCGLHGRCFGDGKKHRRNT